MKKFTCVSKTYFLLKIFGARFHPFRKSIFTKFLQKYGWSILNMLNIDENYLQIQIAINILTQLHSSLCRKKICKGIKYLLHSNIHSSDQIQNPIGHLQRKFFLQKQLTTKSHSWFSQKPHNRKTAFGIQIQPWKYNITSQYYTHDSTLYFKHKQICWITLNGK